VVGEPGAGGVGPGREAVGGAGGVAGVGPRHEMVGRGGPGARRATGHADLLAGCGGGGHMVFSATQAH
jgi:hypothetical protein